MHRPSSALHLRFLVPASILLGLASAPLRAGDAPAPGSAPGPAAVTTAAAPACACGDACAGADCTCGLTEEAKKGHALRGVVVDVLADKQALLVRHEEIPGVMKAMTMLLRVEPADLEKAKKGDALTGRLVRRDTTWWLLAVRPAAPAAAVPTATAPAPAAGASGHAGHDH